MSKNLTFYWQGINKAGECVQGELTANNSTAVKQILRSQGIIVRTLKKRSFAFLTVPSKKLKAADLVLFSRQLATLYAAGVPLLQALEVISKGAEKPAFKNILLVIKQDIASGLALHLALAKHPKFFNELYCNLIAVGEQAGTLDVILQQLATHQENLRYLKQKINQALFYPAVIFMVVLLVSAVLLLFVVPQFEALFQSLGGQLPAFTKMVINLAQFLKHYLLLVAMVILALGALFNYLRKTHTSFNMHLANFFLKLPVLGKLIQQTALARFARTLALTFAAGLPILDALTCVRTTIGHPCFELAVHQASLQVQQGHSITVALQQTKRFPSLVEQLVAIGEAAGSLELMLIKISEFYENELKLAVATLSNLLEPFIMVILGLLMGGLVVAMYLPIFKLGSLL